MTQWFLKKYNALSKEELYEIIQFRIRIFMLEQQSIYEDLDGLDQEAMHFIAKNSDQIIAYGRVHVDAEKKSAVIRRICVRKEYRNQKCGSVLMKKIIEYIDTFPDLKSAELDAQIHLQQFYERFGFRVDGKPYDDGGIMHIQMVK